VKNKLIKSPMPGIVTKILVKEGDFVKKGEQYLALEAMKMEVDISQTNFFLEYFFIISECHLC
jgi:biotin carboxyl carrier protein